VILVDDLKRYRSGWWCHMVSDRSVEELHAFASGMGLGRGRFQGGRLPHYDLRPPGRRAAVRRGAEEVGSRELVRRMARE
jgi:Protein of unknown function (DUF4031)